MFEGQLFVFGDSFLFVCGTFFLGAVFCLRGPVFLYEGAVVCMRTVVCIRAQNQENKS